VPHMIKAISFDFYNTLVKFWPPLDEIQQAACAELGINVSKTGIDQGYSVADVYFNQENANGPIALRTDDERLEFFSKYEQMILENAGVPVSMDLARQIWTLAMSVPKDFTPFEDVIPALEKLKAQGYRLGVISNLRRDMRELCTKLGLAESLDFFISSADAGPEKPHSPIFLAALDQMSAEPGETVHVGDQYCADVLGARAVGMHTVLIDRGGWNETVRDCPKISDLHQLAELLEQAPNSLTVK
jgi:HAD superfamily hydrolase (TIGR01662 family)